MKPLKIPRGIAMLFCQGLATSVMVDEDNQYRPDFLNNDMRNEVINNWMTNVSPISLTKRRHYMITDVMFMSYFGKI
jgi:hypothetical protein